MTAIGKDFIVLGNANFTCKELFEEYITQNKNGWWTNCYQFKDECSIVVVDYEKYISNNLNKSNPVHDCIKDDLINVNQGRQVKNEGI